jgi:LysR family glycine cleavage system transcriptional activator
VRKKLPSTSGLQAIDAVARNRSFTRAATELGITQAAITQHVQQVEALLGVRLFERGAGKVAATKAGAAYLGAVQGALYGISAASYRLIDHGRGDVVTIASLGAFALKRLLPVLEVFRREHPEIGLHVETMTQFRAAGVPDCDMAIWHGMGEWPGVKAERILDEEIFPVCSPQLLAGAHPLVAPKDLRHHTTVRANSDILRDDWPFWLDAAGVAAIPFAGEVVCNYLLMSLQAALNGVGVAIGRTGLVEADLASGALVEPFGIRLAVPSAYYLVTPLDKPQTPQAAVLQHWLLDRLRAPI